jgi:hypothetical protein
MPTMPAVRRRLAGLLAAVLVGLLVAAGPMLLPVAPASAATARVTVANQDGKAVADPKYATTLTLHGTGFQSIKGGFGGIYVLFGTVKGTWQPSKGGLTGVNYFYVPDSETKDNHGFEKFVTFPGGDTASAANGGVLKADGTWSTTIVVPGSTFTALDRDNKPITIDCLKVTCGIITIGAHGVSNDHNETFTPVRFASLYGGSPSSSPTASSSAPAGSSTTAPGSAPSAPTPAAGTAAAGTPSGGAPAAKAARPAVTVDRDTAVLGHVLSFTATGFQPGEQVIASLDDGVAAIGPLSAGPSGEVAGVLQLPRGLESGTHSLEVTGAASGLHPSANFPISAGTTTPSVPVASGHDRPWPAYAYLGGALLVLAGALAFALHRRRRRAAPVREVTHA